jgi:hypothetical protein
MASSGGGCLKAFLIVGAIVGGIGVLGVGACIVLVGSVKKQADAERATAPQSAPTPNRQGNLANERLATSSAAKRRETLRSVIASAGDPCPGVERTFFNGSAKDGSAFWSVACSNGRSYMVSIAADAGGSTKVLDCAIASECFKKF